ncbi:MAG: aminotransferase class I/II-fold pyridoxal phosphate-dependent enzyme [Ruminococcus sp.]
MGVEFFSLSKSFNVTGARISFLIGQPEVIAALKKLRSQIDFGMFLPIQKAAIAALEGPLDSVKEQCIQYQARRDALCDGLASIGWEKPNGKGTMFVWARIPGGRTDSMAFCMELMEKPASSSPQAQASDLTGKDMCASHWYFRLRKSKRRLRQSVQAEFDV